MEPRSLRRRCLLIAQAVGIRLVVWGGLLALVVWVFGDVRMLLFPDLIRSQPAERPTNAGTSQDPATDSLGDGALSAADGDASATAGWPHLRGPHYDGVADESGLADAWPAEGPPVLWLREIGRGYSGCTVVGSRLFTQAQSLYSQAVLCLEADTGRTLWETRCDWPYDAAGMYPGPRATPTYHRGRIYFATPQGRVGCLDAKDGRLIWSVNVVEAFDGRGHDFGYSCSPLVEAGKVILPVGGQGASVVALNAADGSTVWAAGEAPASYCSAIPVTFRERRYVVAFLENSLALFDLETGRLQWELTSSRGYDEHSAFPLYREPYLLAASPFRAGARYYRLTPGTTPETSCSVAEVWFSKQLSNDVASSVLVGDCIYGFDLRELQTKAHRPSRGEFRCLDWATGKVHWSSELPGHASVLAADGKLILFNDRGEIILVRATAEGYRELGRSPILGEELCWTAPTLESGRLFLRSPTRLACVYVGRPENAGRLRPLAVAAAQLPKSRPRDLGWLVGQEREYPNDAPTMAELRLWYVFTLSAVLVPAAAMAGLSWLTLRLVGRSREAQAANRQGQLLATAVFWFAAFGLGAIATPLANRCRSEFFFTWPICLFVAQQVTLVVIWHAHHSERKFLGQAMSLVAGLGLFGVILLYFHLCRRLGMAVQWVFLLGFLPSWLVGVPAAIWFVRRPNLLRDLLLAVAGYTLFFWACGAYLLWRQPG